jgi:hypothetical protein
VDVDAGIERKKSLDARRKLMQANAVNGGDPDCASRDLLDLLELAVE